MTMSLDVDKARIISDGGDATTVVSSQSILSSKVSRALQVRTDAPALKTALAALSDMMDTHDSNNDSDAATTTVVLDARSVRAAMERDALSQALQLRSKLQNLVQTVQTLRQGVSETAALAHRVKTAIHTPVVVVDTATTTQGTATTLPSGPPTDTTTTPAATTALASSTTVKPDALEEEQQLALVLSEAFGHRAASRKRLEAVHAFLEKFDLTQEDSRLLDHYAFEEFDATEGGGPSQQTPTNGMAFLRALERVRHIRLALTETFGKDPTGGASLELSTLSTTSSSMDRRGLGASSALRMMESLAQKQEGAYERLYHWLLKYLHLFQMSNAAGGSHNNNTATAADSAALDEALQDAFLKQALYTLRHVPAFYAHTLEGIATSRRTEATRRFLVALTSGHAGQPPMEMKAHDAVAYVGDMLAFSFKAFSIEADLAKGIVDYHPDQDKEDDNDEHAEKEEKDQADAPTLSDGLDDGMGGSSADPPITAKEMLAVSMSGLARPLKSRILQVISTLARHKEDDDEDEDGLDDDDDDGLGGWDEEGSEERRRVTHLYDICGLLLFYSSAMDKGVRKLTASSSSSNTAALEESKDDVELEQDAKNPLVEALLECLAEATKAYEATVRVYAALLNQLSVMTGHSQASLAQAMILLVVQVRKHSPGFSAQVECPEASKTTLSMEWVTETLVTAALSTCKGLDDTVVLKSAMEESKQVGLSIVAAQKLYQSIDAREQALIDDLVESETTRVLETCGLSPVVKSWKRWQGVVQQGGGGSDTENSGIVMATYPGLGPSQVQACIKEFYASLFSPPLPSLEEQVKDPVLRKSARSKIAAQVCDIYQALHADVHAKGGYDDLGFLTYKPDQVKALLLV